jgi:hypothetical protein
LPSTIPIPNEVHLTCAIPCCRFPTPSANRQGV